MGHTVDRNPGTEMRGQHTHFLWAHRLRAVGGPGAPRDCPANACGRFATETGGAPVLGGGLHSRQPDRESASQVLRADDVGGARV